MILYLKNLIINCFKLHRQQQLVGQAEWRAILATGQRRPSVLAFCYCHCEWVLGQAKSSERLTPKWLSSHIDRICQYWSWLSERLAMPRQTFDQPPPWSREATRPINVMRWRRNLRMHALLVDGDDWPMQCWLRNIVHDLYSASKVHTLPIMCFETCAILTTIDLTLLYTLLPCAYNLNRILKLFFQN